MWKDSYRLGVDKIDNQHMELFRMVGSLMDVVQKNTGDTKKECISAILYLKDYALQHFRDEEAFQAAIGYKGLQEHRQIHQKFAQDVLRHERKMTASDFNPRDIKDFMGMLIAWLVYHVAGADQLIVKAKKPEKPVRGRAPVDSYFQISTCDILSKITGLEIKDIKVLKPDTDEMQTTIAVMINFRGDVRGTVIYKYARQLAFDIIESMTDKPPETVDEMVCSAMAEISNIISVNAIGLMSKRGFTCSSDIPSLTMLPSQPPSKDSIIFDTGMGLLEMEVCVG